MTPLEELKAKAKNCRACRLAETRTQVVFSRGNPEARLMFVGEAPGADEDKQGLPFVGKAGQLLDRILEAAGIDPDEVYITNVVKCRPPGNRTPLPDEVKVCTQLWLLPEIEIVRPQIIVPLGSVATQFFLGQKVPITKVRGKWFEWNGIKIFPMFHPAYLLRNPSRAPGSPKALTWKDIQEVKRALDELGEKPKPEVRAAKQDPLF